MHQEDHVEAIAKRRSTQRRWPHPERSGDPEPARESRGLADALVIRRLEPEIEVVGGASGALKERTAHAHDDESDTQVVEGPKEGSLSRGEYGVGHEPIRAAGAPRETVRDSSA